MMDDTTTWRKSTRSASQSNCVEVRNDLDALRDSKNQSGPEITVNIRALVAALKSGQIG